ncbi:MAG: helix-turn-helix transcriptional regulator [Planctomycetes bacterium]|nr:helix-turn-helix transcriptional regulator [Planctomycetota bacterium]
MFFGEWLASRRAELGLTLRDIAETAGVPPIKVSLWERGYEDPPYEVRDACWDAMKRDGEVPPLDPAPFLMKREDPLAAVQFKPARRRGKGKLWIEEFAEQKGTTLDDVLRAFGMNPATKYQWRTGKLPSYQTRWKIIQFLEVPEALVREHGWDSRDSDG